MSNVVPIIGGAGGAVATGSVLAISGAPPQATAGTFYSWTPSVTGSQGNLRFTLDGGLPNGLSINSATGEVRGTPVTSQTTSFGLTIRDDLNVAFLPGLTLAVSAGGGPSLPKWAAAKAARAAGTRNATILVIGDSTSWGAGANGSLNGTNGKQFSWPSKLADLLPAGSAEAFFGNGDTSSVNYYPGFDSRDIPGGFGLGGASAKSLGGFPYAASAAATRSWAPIKAVDSVDLFSAKFSGAGSFNVNVDGGATITTISGANASNALAKTPVSFALGTHTLNAVWASGPITIFGAVFYNSAVKQTTVINGGISGSRVADHIISASPWSGLNMIAAVQPDLVIIDLTINDALMGTALATYTANLQIAIDAAKASGADVLMATGNPIAESTGVSQATQQSYVDAFKGKASSNNLPLVDVFALFGDYATANGKSWMFDTKHPNGLGYTQIANAIAAVL